MKIVHRVSLPVTREQRHALEVLGIEVPPGILPLGGGDPHVSIDVHEDHKNWAAIHSLIRDWRAVDLVSTKFTSQELAAAVWFQMQAEWHHGYPQPAELDNGYLAATYKLADYCKKCGAGKRQKGPFWMKAEPKWGSRGIMQLNWVFDEYFMRPEVFKTTFAPVGLKSRPVLDRRGERELNTVVQLCIDATRVPLALDGYPSQICSACGRQKFLPITRGMFPRLMGKPAGQVFKSQEVFGSGASAWHAVIVSSEIYAQLIKHRVKGVAFIPLG